MAYGSSRPGIRSESLLGTKHSCGNARSLTHCAGPGIKPKSQSSQDTADPVTPQWELLLFIYLCFTF